MMSQNQGYIVGGRIPSIVKLNVGGIHFTTSLPGSALSLGVNCISLYELVCLVH